GDGLGGDRPLPPRDRRSQRDITSNFMARGIQEGAMTGAPPAFKWPWTIFIVILTLLPYCVGYWLTPKGYVYTWIIPPFPADSMAYMAWSRQAYNGSVLFSMKYTALPHSPFFFNPFFLVCGWLA